MCIRDRLDIVPDLMKPMDKELNKKKNIFQNDSEDEQITTLDWLDVYKRQIPGIETLVKKNNSGSTRGSFIC